MKIIKLPFTQEMETAHERQESYKENDLVGPYASLKVVGIKDPTALARFLTDFSCEIINSEPNKHAYLLVTNQREEGGHKKQTVELFALALAIHNNIEGLTMLLSWRSHHRDETGLNALPQDGLVLTQDVHRTINQAGCELTSHKLSRADAIATLKKLSCDTEKAEKDSKYA